MEAALGHAVFSPLRRWLQHLDPLLGPDCLQRLNAQAEHAGLSTASGHAVRFVAPSGTMNRYGGYELRVFETGQVETRPGNLHDLFNALSWLAFPLTKARLNALHAREIPHERGVRGRLRDLLTLLDEGGAILSCSDAGLLAMLNERRWPELLWDHRHRVQHAMRVHVMGHAVLEQSISPWPGITCKVIVVPAGADVDAAAALWLEALSAEVTPQALPSLPVFGYPGWLPDNGRRFYEDGKYFRPLRQGDRIAAGVGQAVAACQQDRHAEESPGSAERDAG